jgi:hypothetical protein
MPDGVVCALEITEKKPGRFIGVATATESFDESSKLFRAALFLLETSLERREFVVFKEEMRETFIDENHDYFPERSEEGDGAIVFKVKSVSFFVEEGNNTFTPGSGEFTFTPKIVEYGEKVLRNCFEKEFEKRVGDSEVTGRGGSVKIFDSGREFFERERTVEFFVSFGADHFRTKIGEGSDVSDVGVESRRVGVRLKFLFPEGGDVF